MLTYLALVISVVGIIVILLNYIRNINNKTAWIHLFSLIVEFFIFVMCITDLLA